MPRLIDDLRTTGKFRSPFFVAKRQAWTEYAAHVAALLGDPEMPVVLMDNVAKYFYSEIDQEYFDVTVDFPNIAPPFPRFWMEWKMVTHIHSRDGDSDLSGWLPQGARVGQLFSAVDPKDVVGEGIPENTRWIYWCDMFTDYRRPDGTVDGPYGATWLCVDAEGRAIGNPWIQSFGANGDMEVENMLKSVMSWYNPALFAISFLHCKNVQLIDHAVDAKLAKRYRERHNGARLTPYKTLVIEPLKQILRSEGRSDKVGLAKAMHICRGHFRDYRQGPGLFGKYHKLVWTPSVVRGTKGKGAPPREIEVKL